MAFYKKVRGFLVQDHLLQKKKEEEKKNHQEMLIADLLFPIEIDWGYQYLSSVNNESQQRAGGIVLSCHTWLGSPSHVCAWCGFSLFPAF